MKNLFKLFLILSCIILFVGCSMQTNNIDVEWFRNDEICRTVSSTELIHDLVSRIGGDKILDNCLIRGLDPHSYEPVKGDNEKIDIAEVVFYNGLDLEHSNNFKKIINGSKNIINLSDAAFKNHRDDLLIIGDIYDPHVWLDPVLWKQAIDVVEKELSAIRPEFKDEFSSRASELRKSFEELDLWIKTKLDSVEDLRLVTTHSSFNYFVKRYFLKSGEAISDRYISVEGISPEVQIGIKEVLLVSDFINRHDVKVIFHELDISKDSLIKVLDVLNSKHKKVRLSEKYLCSDTIGSMKYEDMIRRNVNVIVEELNNG